MTERRPLGQDVDVDGGLVGHDDLGPACPSNLHAAGSQQNEGPDAAAHVVVTQAGGWSEAAAGR